MPYIKVPTHINSIPKCTAEVNEKAYFSRVFRPFYGLIKVLTIGWVDMPYIIEVVRAGSTIEVSKYYSSRFNKKGIGKN